MNYLFSVHYISFKQRTSEWVWFRYGAEQGRGDLREAIAEKFYPEMRSADEIFVSDGSKCDIGRIQMMFGMARSVAVQDPSYPVYVDTSVIQGCTQEYNPESEGFDGIEYMLCNADNGFFPDLSKVILVYSVQGGNFSLQVKCFCHHQIVIYIYKCIYATQSLWLFSSPCKRLDVKKIVMLPAL